MASSQTADHARKSDLDAMGLLKVDVLALGMLTAIRKSLDLIGQRKGRIDSTELLSVLSCCLM